MSRTENIWGLFCILLLGYRESIPSNRDLFSLSLGAAKGCAIVEKDKICDKTDPGHFYFELWALTVLLLFFVCFCFFFFYISVVWPE